MWRWKGSFQRLDGNAKTDTSPPDLKKEANIAAKAARPATKKKYPWFGVEHVRDALRFRSVIDDIAAFEDALTFFSNSDMPVVKIDLDKMCRGNSWGWRFAAIDFRLTAADGQLIEYYATFKALMMANNNRCHQLYEHGRNLRADEGDGDLEYLMQQSRDEYDNAWAAALNALDLDQPTFEREWSALKARLGRP